jgi:hypothetical protein
MAPKFGPMIPSYAILILRYAVMSSFFSVTTFECSRHLFFFLFKFNFGGFLKKAHQL